MPKVILLSALLLFSACRRHLTYEEAVYHQPVSPGRYLVQCEVSPVATAIQWVHRKAAELCGAQYTLEGASVTNQPYSWRDGYGRTWNGNRAGYVATAVCPAQP